MRVYRSFGPTLLIQRARLISTQSKQNTKSRGPNPQTAHIVIIIMDPRNEVKRRTKVNIVRTWVSIYWEEFTFY